jgi:hypothetical protein
MESLMAIVLILKFSGGIAAAILPFCRPRRTVRRRRRSR